jgi:hypothetical protein
MDFNGDKNPQHTFLRVGGKAEGPIFKFLQHVKEPCVALRCYVSKIQGHFSRLPCFTARSLVDESGVLELKWGRTVDQKMVTVLGTLCTTPPRKSNQ